MNQPLIQFPAAEEPTQPAELTTSLLRHTGLRRQSVAVVLRETRERYGQSLPAVSDHLRIRIGHLEAIEDGRFADLPGVAYAAGFVRSYAEFLGLDANEVVQRFRAETASLNGQKSELVFPALASEAKFPKGSVLFLSVLLAALVYGGWYYLSDRNSTEIEQVGEVPAELRAPATDTRVADIEQRAPAWSAAGPVPADGAAPAAPDQAVAAETPPEPVLLSPSGYALVVPSPKPTAIPPLQVAALEEAVPELPIVEAEPTVSPAAPVALSRVFLKAKQESWVQVQGADGSTLFAEVLRAGHIYPVPDQPGLTLVTGNAGGLEIWVDGRPLPPMGGIGVVRRGVSLDPAQLIARASAQKVQ